MELKFKVQSPGWSVGFRGLGSDACNLEFGGI